MRFAPASPVGEVVAWGEDTWPEGESCGRDSPVFFFGDDRQWNKIEKCRHEVTNEDVFLELLSQAAHMKAHLETLFMMQCELFAHVSKTSSTAIAETWGGVRQQFLKENLESINELC